MSRGVVSGSGGARGADSQYLGSSRAYLSLGRYAVKEGKKEKKNS